MEGGRASPAGMLGRFLRPRKRQVKLHRNGKQLVLGAQTAGKGAPGGGNVNQDLHGQGGNG